MTRRWLIDLPTRIHLWSAEFQIRHRSPSPNPARLRNLDVLRAYRKSRAFPRNDTGLPRTPYFVDAAGRHCAVGHLMRESGATDAVRRIAADTNLARIDDMNRAVLTDWTARSGLTQRELARIQPNYPNDSQWAVVLLLWSSLVMIPLALLSVVLHRVRADRTGVRSVLTVAGLGLCTVLTWFVWSLLSEAGEGPGLIATAGWGIVLVGPIFAAVVTAFLVRDGRIAAGLVTPASGVLTGGLMTLLATVYLILDVVVPNPSDFDPGVISMRPDHPIFWSPPAFIALALGLLTLAWSLPALHRTVADQRA
ncbi:hypothetical protein [Kribbella sp. NPDC048928]|uniref:hypothetical protein n=1 Tax=Kribbella sp. NPDC048928 TaxID=3364111 RepID=UPI00371FD5E9